MGVDGAFEGLHAAPLTEAVEKDRLVGVLLVRLGRYAVGGGETMADSSRRRRTPAMSRIATAPGGRRNVDSSAAARG